jgi:hypothetical protein
MRFFSSSRTRRQGRKRQRPARRPNTCCLRLERLEDRCLLSHFSLGALVQVAPVDPFAGSNLGNAQDVNFPGTQVEPRLAVDPTNPNHLVGVWQQDRWSVALAQGIVAGVSFDGGQSWSEVVVPGLTTASGGSFQRASDPWVSFGPTGALFVSSLLAKLDNQGKIQKSGIAVSNSTDGGLTWSPPTLLSQTNSSAVSNDKEAITADPHNPNLVYTAWDQPNSNFPGAGPAAQTFFSRSTDGGQTWSAPQVIFQSPGTDTSLGHQIFVLPNGTLVDSFVEYHFDPSTSTSSFFLDALRSSDGGLTWSQPVVAAQEMPFGPYDPFNGDAVRSADVIPEVAADPSSGNLYAVWQDSRFSVGGMYDSIAFSMSADGGLTWSSPIAINQTPANLSAPLDSQAMNPSIAVGADGTVAVTYYDFRYQGSVAGAATDTWAVFGNPEGSGGLTNPANWGNELRLTGASFNLLNAPITEKGLFLGDYQGLAAAGSGFDAFFSQAGSVFPQASVFSRQIVVGPPGPPAPAPASTPPTVVLLPPSAPPPPTGFLAPASYPVDQAPDAVAVGDFTNNGIPDLVVANSASNSVSVLLGNGDDTFQPEVKSTVGKGPRSVAVGDFNGDGNLDLVTANQNDISVLLGTGKGTFGSANTFTLPNAIDNQVAQIPLAVAVGDLNHDGKLDLVVAAAAVFPGGNKGFIDVLLGQGDGTFKVGSITPINSSFTLGPGGIPVEIALADLNGDGIPDVVTSNPTSGFAFQNGGGSSISVLLGNGDGTFRETNDANVGLRIVTAVTVGDFNNDHIPDVVVNGSATRGFAVSVLVANGNGTFQAPQLLLLGAQVASVGVGDFNRDGNLDIVTGNFGGTVSVLLGNGNGTFQAPLNFSSGVDDPAALAVADLNHDGFPDLAVTNSFSNGSVGNNVAVLINSGSWPAVSSAPAAPALATFVGPATGTALPTTLVNSLTIMPAPAGLPSEIMMAAEKSDVLDQLFASGNWWSDSSGADADPLSPTKLSAEGTAPPSSQWLGDYQGGRVHAGVDRLRPLAATARATGDRARASGWKDGRDVLPNRGLEPPLS